MKSHDFSITGLRKALDLDGSLDLSLKELHDDDVPVKELKEVQSLRQLDLSDNYLERLPDTFCASVLRLTRLDLSKNHLKSLPSSIDRLQHLEFLDLYRNELTTLPPQFGNLKKLKWLDMKNNPWTQQQLVASAALCTTTKGCEQAAKKVVEIMMDVQRNNDRKKQEELKKKRDSEAKEKKAQEAEEARLRQEKKQAKEKRKAEAAKQNRATNANGNHARNAAPEVKKSSPTVSAKQKPRGTGGSWTMFFLKSLMAVGLLILQLLVILTFFKADGNYSQENLIKSWTAVVSDAQVFTLTGVETCREKLEHLKGLAEDFLNSENAVMVKAKCSHAVKVSRDAVVDSWAYVQKTTGELNVRETLSGCWEWVLTVWPEVHRFVRTYYLWIVQNSYDCCVVVTGKVSQVIGGLY